MGELKTKWATSDLAHKGPFKYSRTERAGTPFELASNKELITKTVTDDEIKNAQQAIEKLALKIYNDINDNYNALKIDNSDDPTMRLTLADIMMRNDESKGSSAKI